MIYTAHILEAFTPCQKEEIANRSEGSVKASAPKNGTDDLTFTNSEENEWHFNLEIIRLLLLYLKKI